MLVEDSSEENDEDVDKEDNVGGKGNAKEKGNL